MKGVTVLKRGKLVDLETIRKAPNEVLHPVQTQYTEYIIRRFACFEQRSVHSVFTGLVVHSPDESLPECSNESIR